VVVVVVVVLVVVVWLWLCGCVGCGCCGCGCVVVVVWLFWLWLLWLWAGAPGRGSRQGLPAGAPGRGKGGRGSPPLATPPLFALRQCTALRQRTDLRRSEKNQTQTFLYPWLCDRDAVGAPRWPTRAPRRASDEDVPDIPSSRQVAQQRAKAIKNKYVNLGSDEALLTSHRGARQRRPSDEGEALDRLH